MKRRKGKRRPPTIGRNCRHLFYERDSAKCRLKTRGRKLCSKSAVCGFEEDCNGKPMVETLMEAPK